MSGSEMHLWRPSGKKVHFAAAHAPYTGYIASLT
jgi:hypothetical protein